MDRKSKIIIITSVIALSIVVITVTYAYFSARITGIESASTISLTAGTMGIVYTEGNEEVSFNNIYPKNDPWVTKTFTLTANNTTALTMYYDLGLNVTTNNFPDNYLTYDLTLVSSTNGTPIATKTNQSINGTGKIKFGKGSFTDATNDTHNYELKIYFKDNGENQNEGQGKVFNAKIYLQESFNEPEGWNDAPANTLLAAIKSSGIEVHNGDSETPKTAPGIASPSSNEGLIATEDDYGTSFYYRGNVENNYVVFANMCWQIVRIDGQGNIKIVLYNQNSNNVTNPCATSEDGNDISLIYMVPFNTNNNKNTYVGLMHSNNPDSNDYNIAHANDTYSILFARLGTFYNQKLNSYNEKIADTIWCNDKSVISDTNYYNPWNFQNVQGTGVGTDVTYYSASARLLIDFINDSSYEPSLVCPNTGTDGKLSKFTARDTTYGNGKLNTGTKDPKIGLLTADEVIFAGGLDNTNGSPSSSITYYLNKNISSSYWTMSPSDFSGEARVFSVGSDGYLYAEDVTERLGLRPAISLKSNVNIVSGGLGTQSNPFVIS